MHTAHYLRNNMEFDDLSKANILHCLICIYINRFLEMKKETKNNNNNKELDKASQQCCN